MNYTEQNKYATVHNIHGTEFDCVCALEIYLHLTDLYCVFLSFLGSHSSNCFITLPISANDENNLGFFITVHSHIVVEDHGRRGTQQYATRNNNIHP